MFSRAPSRPIIPRIKLSKKKHVPVFYIRGTGHLDGEWYPHQIIDLISHLVDSMQWRRVDKEHIEYKPFRWKLNRTVREFHELYYKSNSRTWGNTFWFGQPAAKCPLDLWIYQEIIFQLRPDLIVETGTNKGGSALFMANMCDLLDHGEVVTVDIVPVPDDIKPEHRRITYLTGSSTSPEILNQVQERRKKADSCLVILDSDHSKSHVLNELRLYSSLVSKGSYLIVEDTNLNGHPVLKHFGPGPWKAVEEFLAGNSDFLPDESMEKFYMTQNPKGFLKKIHETPLPRIILTHEILPLNSWLNQNQPPFKG